MGRKEVNYVSIQLPRFPVEEVDRRKFRVRLSGEILNTSDHAVFLERIVAKPSNSEDYRLSQGHETGPYIPPSPKLDGCDRKPFEFEVYVESQPVLRGGCNPIEMAVWAEFLYEGEELKTERVSRTEQDRPG